MVVRDFTSVIDISAIRWRNDYPMARSLKAYPIALIFVLILGAALYIEYGYRHRLRAVVRHILHGNSVTLDGYRVNVPKDWFAEQDSAADITLWNTTTGESVWLHSVRRSPNFTLEYWSDAQEKMNPPENPIVTKRELRVADQTFVCLEKDYTVNLPPYLKVRGGTSVSHLPSVQCASTAPIEIMFFGGISAKTRRNYQDFYSIVSLIQKM